MSERMKDHDFTDDYEPLRIDTKPDWKNAPYWANYLAMDKSGDWYWFENKPKKASDSFAMVPSWSKHCIASYFVDYRWDKTLEERPSLSRRDEALEIIGGRE